MHALILATILGTALAEPTTAASAEGGAAPAAEAPDPEPVTEEPFGEVLADARRIYFEGGHERALALLVGLRARLDGGEGVPREDATAALTYLGEIQYELGDQAGAWDTFETLLRAHPDHTISPYHHPTDVIAWFELVRRRVQQSPEVVETPATPPQPAGPLPGWAYAPLGIPQLHEGRAVRGAVLGGLQLALGAVSLASWAHMETINGPHHPPGLDDDEVARAVQRERWLVQVPATAGFYALWAVSHLEARRAWHHRPPVTAAPGPGGVVVTGRF